MNKEVRDGTADMKKAGSLRVGTAGQLFFMIGAVPYPMFPAASSMAREEAVPLAPAAEEAGGAETAGQQIIFKGIFKAFTVKSDALPWE